jgi:hypothetical protein
VKLDALQELARLYLEKSMTSQEAREVVKSGGLSNEQADAIRQQRAAADELRLAQGGSESWENKLKWFVGKKSIGALGCFGCHNIPGFESAKPIGTPLNDWGKKDPSEMCIRDRLGQERPRALGF